MSDVKVILFVYKLFIENDRDRFEERVMLLLDRVIGNWISFLVGLFCLYNVWVFNVFIVIFILFLCMII